MKILYIANVRLPTEKAHGLQIVKTCQALAEAGAEVLLVRPSRRNKITTDPFDFYGVGRSRTGNRLRIETVGAPEFKWLGRLGFFIHALFFVVSLQLNLRQFDPDISYSRDQLILTMLWLFGIRRTMVFESHTGSSSPVGRFLVRKVAGIVCITQALKDFYTAEGIRPEKILVARDAVDPQMFENLADRQLIRKEIGFSTGDKIVMYSGSFSLYPWKGLDVLIESAKFFGPRCFVVAIGGTPTEIEDLKKLGLPTNVKLLEKISPQIVPRFLVAADVLVIPNKTGDIVSERYTSPMKLFEYMMSGVPIVASNLPSIREVLDDSNATLVLPDSPRALAAGITAVLNDPVLARGRSDKARAEVIQKYSWHSRGRLIVDFVRDITKDYKTDYD